jgi:hypothetical protein
VAERFAQPDDAQARAEPLFGMGPMLKDFLHYLGAVRSNGVGPFHHATGSPLEVFLMGLGTVFFQGGESTRLVTSEVGRDAFARFKELHRLVRQPHIQLLMN